jgi:ribosomal protein S18 acetylase RimI-like enzyme
MNLFRLISGPIQDDEYLLYEEIPTIVEKTTPVSIALKILEDLDEKLCTQRPKSMALIMEKIHCCTDLTHIRTILKQSAENSHCTGECLVEFKASDNHLLHDHITNLTFSSFSKNAEIKETLRTFLELLGRIWAHYSYKGCVKLDFSRELALMDIPSPIRASFTILTFDPKEIPENIHSQLNQIDKESFYGNANHSPYLTWARRMIKATVYVALEQNCSNVAGALVSQRGPIRVLWITYLVRKPNAAKMGIGNMLLKTVITEAVSTNRAALKIRLRQSNNAAQQLLKKFGFELQYFWQDFYRKPSENAVVMAKKLDNL